MKLTYYGTAAAEGFPGIFCECEACKRARSLGGRNLRSRSQALIDEELLIDFPADTLYHVYTFGLPLHKIQNLLITHKHPDHLYPGDLVQRQIGYAALEDEAPLHIYGSQPSVDQISSTLQRSGCGTQRRWELHELLPFETRTIGSYQVTPLKANHDFATYPYIYDIADAHKRILYGNDTGLFLEETWDYLKEARPYYSLVSLDCTAGNIEVSYNCHMNLRQNAETKEKLCALGCADEKTIFISHHFTHNCHAVYDDLVAPAAEKGFLVSYDGMQIEV